MILDSSAIIAILRREPGWERYEQGAHAAASVVVSAATLVECGLVAGVQRREELRTVLRGLRAVVLPFEAEHVDLAWDGHARYGKGSGSPARLNLGDCFAYALAKSTGEPLLFKGDDFTHTDVEPALG